MGLSFLSAFVSAGGKEAIRALHEAIVSATPGISGQAGTMVQESKLDDAADVITRTQHQVDEAQRQFDVANGQYQQKMGAAEVLQQKIAGFQAIIDDPDRASEHAQVQTQLAATNAALTRLVDQIEHMVPNLEHYREELAHTQQFLNEAKEAYRVKAGRMVNDVQGTKEAARDLEQARLRAENAAQREADAKMIVGLASDSSENPAIAAMKRATQKANDEAAQHQLKADTLRQTATQEDDDPIIKAAMAEASGTVTDASVADRLAALKTARH